MLWLTVERKNRGWTQKKLSLLTNIDISNICKIENGRLKPYPVWMKRLGDAFDIDPDMLLAEVKGKAAIE